MELDRAKGARLSRMRGDTLGQSDAEHIAGSLAEPQLFSLIFERHARAVFKFLSRQVNHEAADDLLAET